MSMMNAEVTAENRPACDQVSTGISKWHTKTHKNQSCVQVFIMLLHELPVILLCLLAVVLKKPSSVIFSSG